MTLNTVYHAYRWTISHSNHMTWDSTMYFESPTISRENLLNTKTDSFNFYDFNSNHLKSDFVEIELGLTYICSLNNWPYICSGHSLLVCNMINTNCCSLKIILNLLQFINTISISTEFFYIYDGIMILINDMHNTIEY